MILRSAPQMSLAS